MVSSPQRSIEKPCRPSAYTVYHGGINMSTFCDVGGGFFFSPVSSLVCGHQEWGWRGRSTPFEDDHRRRRNPLSTPAALWVSLCSLSSSWPTPKDATFGTREWNDRQSQTIPRSAWEWRGRAKRIPFQVSGESSGMYRTTLQDYSQWLPLIEDVIDFFVSPYKPLSYTSLRGLVVYRRTTVVIESI